MTPRVSLRGAKNGDDLLLRVTSETGQREMLTRVRVVHLGKRSIVVAGDSFPTTKFCYDGREWGTPAFQKYNVRTLHALSPELQRRIAEQERLEILDRLVTDISRLVPTETAWRLTKRSTIMAVELARQLHLELKEIRDSVPTEDNSA